MANKYSQELGSSTELMLTTKYRLVPTLCAMISRDQTRRTRFAAARCLRCLCQDVTRGSPAVVQADPGPSGLGAVETLVGVVLELREGVMPHPLLREGLEALKLMASSPGGVLVPQLLVAGAKEALTYVAADLKLEDPYRGTSFDRVGLSDTARDALGFLTDLTDGGGVAANVGVGGRALAEPGVNPKPSPRPQDQPGTVDVARGKGPPGYNGSYTAVGVTSHGSLLGGAKDEVEATAITPLALLSARDKAFRNELRRRKRYYELDRAEDESGKAALPLAVQEDGDEDAGTDARPHAHAHMPVVPLKSVKSRTVASLRQNPHLAATRPTRPRPITALETEAAEARTAEGAARGRLTPLAKQKRQQYVAPAVALPNTLMLDPTFGDVLANTSGDRSKASETGSLKQISAHTLGAEQFRHTSSIFGHQIGVMSHRVAAGRVSYSSAHAETVSFKNVEHSVAAMLSDRAKNGDGMKAPPLR